MNDDTSPVARGLAYAREIVAGGRPANQWTRKACERHLRDLERAERGEGPFVFDEAAGNAVCDFVELLPHVKGKWAAAHEAIRLEPWQCWILSSMFGWVHREGGLRRFRTAYFSVPRKNGKALGLDTPIPTPDGWTTMGDLREGDTVYGEDGKACRVVWTSEVRHNRPCYRLGFSNGEQVVADAEHLWLTTARVDLPGAGVGSRRAWGPGKQITRVRTTAEIVETLRYGKRGDTNHSLPMPSPIEGREADLPIAPYTLGAWLGDGNSNGPHITCGDEDVLHFTREIGADGYHIGVRPNSGGAWTLNVSAEASPNGGPVSRNHPDNLRKQLRGLGVLNDKHIPQQYLRASVAQRVALLQGLMDTDGTCAASGKGCQYVSVSEKLAAGVAELLASLGVKYSVRPLSMRCNGRPVPGTAYSIQFNAFSDELPVFRLERKLRRMRRRSDLSTAPRSRTVQIVSSEEVPSEPVRCIGVDSPSRLFLFGRTMLPTHNSIVAGAVGLYMLAADGEHGAEVYSGATTEKQAWEVFRPARLMAAKTPAFCAAYGVEVNAKTLAVLENGSRFEPVIGKPGDGASPSCAIVDEYHEHATPELLDTMRTGMAAREQPLLLVITTAGVDTASPCYALQTDVQNVLSGVYEDDSLFGVVYGIDPEDDWTTEAALVKANPNWGVSVLPDIVRAAQQEAIRNASKSATFKTKHLNVWCGAREPYFNLEAWRKGEDTSLQREQFSGEDAFIGVDLASKKDIASVVTLFRRDVEGATHYYVFTRHYLPEERVNDPGFPHYAGWALQGWMTPTPGDITDFRTILDGTTEEAVTYGVKAVGYDPHAATMFATELAKEGVPVVEVRQNWQTLSEPMKWLDAMIIAGRVHHNGDPVLAWMMGNVTARPDANENVFPRKERPENKIDGAVALIIAMGRAMADASDDGASVYETRGLVII